MEKHLRLRDNPMFEWLDVYFIHRPKDPEPYVQFAYVGDWGRTEFSVWYPSSQMVALGESCRHQNWLLAKGYEASLTPDEVYQVADWAQKQIGPKPPPTTVARPDRLEDLDGINHLAVRLSVGFGGPEDPTVEFWEKDPYALVGALRVSVLKTADEKGEDMDGLKFDDRHVLLPEHVARVGIWVAAKLGFVQREPPVPTDPDRAQTERIKKLQTMLEEQRQHLLATVTDEDAKADLLDELTRLYRDKMMEVLRDANAP